KVSGTISYSDSASNTHPARRITVQVIDARPKSNVVLATSVTNQAGQYTASVPTFRPDGTTRARIVVKALAADSGFSVHARDPATAYHIDPAPASAAGAPMTINLTADNSGPPGTAFNVSDALVTALNYTRTLNGGNLFPRVSINFPMP